MMYIITDEKIKICFVQAFSVCIHEYMRTKLKLEYNNDALIRVC